MISKEKIKFIRSLHQKKFRDKHQQFLIEGPKMLKEAMQHAPDALFSVFGIEEKYPELPENCEYHQINSKELSQISVLQHPQEMVAVCNFLSFSPEPSNLVLALDTLQNPGNLGTILRLAAWYGVTNVIATKETVDVYNPKVVQASMGAVFHVKIEYVDLRETLEKMKLPVYGAVMNGKNIYQEKIKEKAVLLIGNEGNGIQNQLMSMVDYPITIPKFGKGESLNAAMATAILLSEFTRIGS